MGYLLGFRWASLGASSDRRRPRRLLLRGASAGYSRCLASSLKTSQTVQGISTAILFPLSFLSGAFVPTSTLPWWLQDFVNVNPLTYVVSAVRRLLNQGTIGNDFWLSLIGSIAVVIVFAPLTLRAYMRKA